MDKDKLKYDRTDWINRGNEAGWWERPIEYERDTDITSLAVMIGQLLRFDKVIKKGQCMMIEMG